MKSEKECPKILETLDNGVLKWRAEGFRYSNKTIARTSPCYRGRNGSLLSIGQKGRFLRVENAERKIEQKESKEQERVWS